MSEEIIAAVTADIEDNFYRKSRGDIKDMQVVANRASGEIVELDFSRKYPDADLLSITDALSLYSYRNNTEGIAGIKKDTLEFVYSSGAYETTKQYILDCMKIIEDRYRTPRIIANAMRGEEYAIQQLEEAEVALAPLRDELHALDEKYLR